MSIHRRFLSAVLALSLLAAACASPASPPASAGASPAAAPAPQTQPPPSQATARQSLTVYSGRTEELVGPVIEQFSSATGIKVNARYGSTSGMAATILEEGKNSPADVFFAQDPAGLGAVAPLLAPLPERILSRVEPRLRSPQGNWVGISGRARTVVYNTRKLKEGDLPDDIWDFTDPKWRGRIGWSPTNGSFQAMVTAMRVLWGEEKTRKWVEGIKANKPKDYSANTPIVDAVGKGEIDVGLVNHYYLFRFLEEQGESFPARNYHPRAGGPGAIMMVAGAGILQTSRNRDAAERFIEYLLSPVAQQYFASQTFEYPVVKGVTTHRALVPLASIKSPEMEMAQMADLKGTLSLLRGTGVLP
ncbi:MAG: iron ABC transporter substrate-binding protein [Chloroflexi bacterium]|nr:iron ABC transporter substrate-binding protein [Chloroflexota bacterium]